MKILKNKNINLIITIIVSILCFGILHKSNALENVGMAAIFLNWLPLIIGIFTIILYFITNLISEKYSWLIIILGNVFNIVILINLVLKM